MNFLTWAATVDLEHFIAVQYLTMGFFAIGAFTSSNNRNKRVFISNLATLVAIFLAFFFRLLIAAAALRFEGSDGPALAGILSNDIIRVLFNFVLIIALLYRMIKTCCHMRMRELSFANIMDFRKRRIPHA